MCPFTGVNNDGRAWRKGAGKRRLGCDFRAVITFRCTRTKSSLVMNLSCTGSVKFSSKCSVLLLRPLSLSSVFTRRMFSLSPCSSLRRDPGTVRVRVGHLDGIVGRVRDHGYRGLPRHPTSRRPGPHGPHHPVVSGVVSDAVHCVHLDAGQSL